MVNDRWGGPHKDYATSEYEHFSQPESETQWEKCRGVGFSFGYNQVEGPEQSLTGRQLAQHLTDVVSRGGHFLLNVGPKADGTIPEIQRRALTDLGRWMATAKEYLVGALPLEPAASTASGGESSWIRWVDRGPEVVAFIDSTKEDAEIVLGPGAERFAFDKASVAGPGGALTFTDGALKVTLTADRLGPVVVRVPRS